MANIHVEGRRWFQRSYGNTYNSVAITIDGETTVLPREYGYGDHWLQRAKEWLAVNGFPEVEGQCFTIWLRDNKCTYSLIDVTRKRDLHE